MKLPKARHFAYKTWSPVIKHTRLKKKENMPKVTSQNTGITKEEPFLFLEKIEKEGVVNRQDVRNKELVFCCKSRCQISKTEVNYKEKHPYRSEGIADLVHSWANI